MKKRTSIKEQRTERQQAAKKGFQEKAENKKANDVQIRLPNDNKVADIITSEENDEDLHRESIAVREREAQKRAVQGIYGNKVSNSKVKAAGLKSVFTLSPNEMLMTTFGKGSKALIEKKIVDGIVKNVSSPENLHVTLETKKFHIKGRNTHAATIVNPLWKNPNIMGEIPKSPGDDMTYCRRPLEMQVFGKNYDDNIHVQLIYCILDIQKILAIHVSNIVYEIDNMLGMSDRDFVGCLDWNKTYDEFSHPSIISDGDKRKTAEEMYSCFVKLMKMPQISYLGTIMLNDLVLSDSNKEIDAEAKRKALESKWKQHYYILTVLSMVKRAVAYDDENSIYSLYTLDQEIGESGECREEAKRILDDLFAKRINNINRDFLDKSKKDLVILFKVMEAKTTEEKANIVQDYYDFIVRKNYKRQGFSVKKLREIIFAFHAAELNNEKYNVVRVKLIHCFEFIIFEYYKQEEEQANVLVEKLRSVLNMEEIVKIYKEEAARLWNSIKDIIIVRMMPLMNGEVISRLKGDKNVVPEMISNVCINPDSTYFSKMIYLLTNFLDGKEINDLLTTLINKFDNIAAFIDVMDKSGIEHRFTKNYGMFEKSGRIVDELCVVNSISRMAQSKATTKPAMIREALEILGCNKNDDDIQLQLDNMFKKEPPNYGCFRKDNSFRNFIINNVIESERFKYLIRHSKPNTIRKIASRRNVVEFVLDRMPDFQIVGYYNCITGKQDTEIRPDMRRKLSEIISGISFKQFETVRQKAVTAYEKKEKERMRTIVRLYLTVMYLLVKNLIYINSRYSLAFHCLKRDAMISDSVKYRKDLLREDYTAFVRDFIEQHASRNKRAREYIRTNLDNSDQWSLRCFQNCIEHFDAIRNMDEYIGDIHGFESYFQLYHYLIQRNIIDRYEHDKMSEGFVIGEKTLFYFSKVTKYHSYCMDFLKALTVPFAYNLPRYKNLSIEGLFDRNEMSSKCQYEVIESE